MLTHKKYLEKNLEVSKIIIIFAPQKTTSNNLKKTIMKLYNVIEVSDNLDLKSVFIASDTVEAAEALINEVLGDPDCVYTEEELYQMSQEALEAFDNDMWWKDDDSERVFSCVEIEVSDNYFKNN